MIGKTIGKIKVGDTASFRKTVTETDVYLFAGITGDLNPAHIDDVSAKEGVFGRRIAHGMLSAGFISAVLGMKLPGPGTIYLSQELRFTAPVAIDDTVEAKVKVIEILDQKNQVKLETICTNQNDRVVLKGYALVMPPKEEEKDEFSNF